MHPFLNFEFLRISFAVHGNNKAGEWCARFPDRFCNSYVHPRDRIRRLSARSLHTWMLFQITTAARNRDGGRRKKRDSISHNGVSGSIPPHTRRPANGSRRGLVGFPSYTPIACRFVVRIEKVRPEVENHDFRVRPPPPPPSSTFVRAFVVPDRTGFCSADNEAQNRLNGRLAIALRRADR